MQIESNCVHPEERVSGWQLDQYELGMLSARDVLAIERHLVVCDACEKRLATRQEDAAQALELPGFDALVAAGMARLEETSRAADIVAPAPKRAPVSAGDTGWSWWQMWSMSGMSLAAMAVMILVFLPEAQTSMPWPSENAVPTRRSAPARHQPPPVRRSIPARVGKTGKSVFAVVHFHKGTKYSQWTKPNEQLQPGDLIQFAYQLPTATHAMICSINAQGEISVFFPLGGRRSARLEAGAGTLPHNGSLELDDYLGQERVWIVTSPKAIAFSALKRAMLAAFVDAGRTLGKMTEVKGPWEAKSLLLQKTRKRSQAPPPKRQIAPPVRPTP